MPRSSRHKSSKHSSRDGRDYSDSEKDSSSKDRRSKEESSSVKVFKESGSAEKRKLESNKDSGNGEYLEEYTSSSSKRRKERVEDDRWNGGDDDNRGGEGTKKSKEKSSESKSKRRDESAGAAAVGVYVEIDEVVKKSSGKSEGKHRESSSSRKEGREGGTEKERDKERERDRRGKEGKSDKLIDGDDLRLVKQFSDRTEFNARDLLQSPEPENLPDRQIRRKRDGCGDGDKHQDDIGDYSERKISSREDVSKGGRLKDEKHKDERYRDKYREDVDRESRHRDDKQRDERAAKDHINSRSDDKHLKDDKDSAEIRLKKYKPQDGERDREPEHDHDRDFDLGRDHESYQRDRDRDHDREREQDRDHDKDRDRERDWDWDREREWDRERDRERERDRGRDRERDRDRDRNIDYDGAHMDDRGARHKDSRGRKRSPEDHDDYNDAKGRGNKTSYLDMEKKSLSSNRVESDADRGRSQSRQGHQDNRRRVSPNTSSHGVADEYRQFKQEEPKYRDAVVEQRSKSKERTNLPGSSERASKYRSSEKVTKMDDGHMRDPSLERSSSKASPMGLMDRSPSSTSLERSRYVNRSSVRRSLDIEESGRRSSASMGARDMSSADDRPNRDLPLEKSLVDDTTSVDSSFYNRNTQSNTALIPPSAFRGGIGSPSFLGPMEEDGRMNTGGRYKRSGDPNLGRAQGNAWRGAPNWSSPVPNGYIPFQHGPPHGGFQAMMPQFPSPLFGVRPSMEINHSGIPYHMAEADRFSTHLRPLGWQNIMDGSGPSHMHGWDENNGVFRDESHIYGGPEWDQNRHPINGRGWENSADVWKVQNGDVNLDLPSTSLKEDFPVQPSVEDVSAGRGGQKSQNESNHLGAKAKTVETKLALTASTKESSESSPKTIHEKTLDPPKVSNTDDSTCHYRAYLSKLDISIELIDPELYSQFMSLRNIEQSATVDEDTPMLVNLKDGARAVPKGSSTLLNSSFFPVTSDSVFQRAMDIYKRQRVCLSGSPISNGRVVDFVAASIIEEEVPGNTAEKSDVQMIDSEEKKVETVPVADVQENSDVLPSQEVDIVGHSPDLKLESPGQALGHDTSEKPMIIFGGDKMDGVPSKLVDSDGPPQGDFVSTPDDVPSAVKVLPSDGNNMDETSKVKGRNSFKCAEDGQGFGAEICGPLLFKDGSTKASGDLIIPESNESESVILSRIHHSPESTH